MKKLFTLCFAVLATATLWAQSPDQISYQTVIRDTARELVIEVALIYTETHTPTTYTNGLVSVAFGVPIPCMQKQQIMVRLVPKSILI